MESVAAGSRSLSSPLTLESLHRLRRVGRCICDSNSGRFGQFGQLFIGEPPDSVLIQHQQGMRVFDVLLQQHEMLGQHLKGSDLVVDPHPDDRLHDPALKPETRAAELGQISRSIRSLARELRIPFVLLAQLNRNADRSDRGPQLTDLKDSGSLEQDADVVMLLYRPATKATVEVIIPKNRIGPTGTIELTWIPEQTRFANVVKDDDKRPMFGSGMA
jgi:hypothetical protein